MKQIFRSSLLALCAGGLCSVALAKLPAPTPEAAAKAAEAAAKAAWSGKVDNYKLCQAQDRVAAHYRKTAKDAKPAAASAPCADPGPFATRHGQQPAQHHHTSGFCAQVLTADPAAIGTVACLRGSPRR